jgi:hypothetical protein
MLNIQSTLRTAPDLCKNVSLLYYSVAKVIHTYSVRNQLCVAYIYTYSLQYRDDGRAKEIKNIGAAVNAACQGNLSSCHWFNSPGIISQSVLSACFKRSSSRHDRFLGHTSGLGDRESVSQCSC